MYKVSGLIIQGVISMINKQQIINLLKIGEQREIEFKESKKKLPKSLWETYSSFANTRGRNYYIGNKRG